MKTTAEFYVAINEWLNAVRVQILDPQVNASKYARNEPAYSTIDFVPGGAKFLRINAIHGGRTSVWAFIALSNGESKGMGDWKQGDIFKAATYKAPAKHSRGNIFENLPLCNITQWTGPGRIIK